MPRSRESSSVKRKKPVAKTTAKKVAKKRGAVKRATKRVTKAIARDRSESSAPTSHDGNGVFVRPQGRYERLAYERQERDLRKCYGDRWNDVSVYGDPDQSQHPHGLWFDLETGQRAVTFIESFCKHHKGEWAGSPLLLEDWQKFVLICVFGWMRPDGTRRFRVAYEEVARKNGKSEKIAGVGNYLLVADGEPGAEVYSTATKEEQAKIIWETAREMVKQSPSLKKWVSIRQKALLCERTVSLFKPLGADSDTLDGLNPHGHLCDEMHAHKKRGLFDVMITAMGARRQPLTFIITTAGIYDQTSIGWEMHHHSQQVLDGVVEDDAHFAIIFAMDEKDDWKTETAWYKANPNLGISVKLDYLREQCKRAQEQPTFLNTFLRLHLNVWTQQVTRWIPIDNWNACEAVIPKLLECRDRTAFLALDLSTKKDITALAIDLPVSADMHDMYWRFYVPEELVKERTKKHAKPDYAAWVRDGWLIQTPGKVIDYEFILNDIVELSKILRIRQLGYDPWNAEHLISRLEVGYGFSRDAAATKMQLIEMRQGMKTLSEPSKEFEKLIISGGIRHDGNPVMRWMVDNAAVRHDPNGNIAPDKENAVGKIDGVVASIMALGRAVLEPNKPTSVYERRGVRIL